MARSSQYKGTEYLQWKHIDLRLKGPPGPDGSRRWIAKITLAYQKGWKDDQSWNDAFELESAIDPNHLVACPVHWLLILALRTGAVAQREIEELEQAAERNLSRSLVWITPERPVLCEFAQQGCKLILERPATNAQLLKSLRSACDLAAMISIPVTHDLRRGAAADIAHLPKGLRGAATTDAARALGHRGSTKDSGLTNQYIGRIHDDTWMKRLDSDFEDHFGPLLAPEPFKRSRQSTTRVKEICAELDLNIELSRDRLRAQGIGRDRLREEWMENAHKPRPEVAKGGDQSSRSSGHFAPPIDAEIPIDPELLAMSEIVISGVQDLGQAASVLERLDAQIDTSHDHFPLNTRSFVTKFAKINIYRNEVVGDTMPLGAVSGGSRDPPSRWRYPCVNAPDCKQTFVTYHLQQSHANNCKPGPPVVLPFACPSCDDTFASQKVLNTHIKHVHGNWTPITCEEEDCPSEEVFQTRGAYLSHRQNNHSDWSPRSCPECPELEAFAKRNAFVAHIKKEHADKVAELMPTKTKKRKRASLQETVEWTPSKCQVSGCPISNTYVTRDKYLQHLRVIHKIKAAESGAFMPRRSESEKGDL